MRGNQWEQGYNRPTGCSAEKAPHATFNFNFKTSKQAVLEMESFNNGVYKEISSIEL
jgi:hypothetical protein